MMGGGRLRLWAGKEGDRDLCRVIILRLVERVIVLRLVEMKKAEGMKRVQMGGSRNGRRGNGERIYR